MAAPVTWRQAWDTALYGERGFYRTGNRPGAHFRTSVHVSRQFAEAVLALARAVDTATIVDLGAGGGELLADLDALDADLDLTGVDLAPRPPGLPPKVAWSHAVPHFDGLLLANEWLDNVPCDVVELTGHGLQHVLVNMAGGADVLGNPPDAEVAAWVERWWPLAAPGQRAEVGLARDLAWARAAGRVGRGLAVAVDYGHLRAGRPPAGTLAGYRAGRRVPAVPDGSGDLTAHVALDSCAAAVPGTVLLSQRSALAALGLTGRRPAYESAISDPATYARRLQVAAEAAELTARGSLGDFGWLISPIGRPLPAVFTTAPAASAGRE